MSKCNCCGRDKELRMGHCFQCVDIESIISTGLDMWDNGIDGKEARTPMEKVKLLIQSGYIKDKTE